MIDIYTDGSCIGNPGPGGWAAIIVENGGSRKVHGSDENTTNNRMEVLAAIQGIEATPSGRRGARSQRQLHTSSIP